MWLGQARQLCPKLVCVPYQFEEYRQVSQQLYEILASYTHEIQAVSCDEAFVDLTNYVEAGQSRFEYCRKTYYYRPYTLCPDIVQFHCACLRFEIFLYLFQTAILSLLISRHSFHFSTKRINEDKRLSHSKGTISI